MDKIEVITLAIEYGFFRAKSEEKHASIIASIVEALECDESEVRNILIAETERRSVAYRNRIARRIAREQAEQNKPEVGVSTMHLDGFNDARYVITCAQNNSVVDLDFLAALKHFAESRNARLLVGKVAYNKNAYLQPESADCELSYPPELDKYYVQQDVMLSHNMRFAATANVLPTARNPLSGFEHITGAGISCVIPHSKQHMTVIPALKGMRHKMLYSTGICTLPNYVQRKAGNVAMTEHVIGALYVTQKCDGVMQVRQIQWRNGEFFDCGERFTATGKSDYVVNPVAVVMGDIHAEKIETELFNRSLSVLQWLNPVAVVCHDTLDFASCNHHNIKNPHHNFAQYVAGNTVQGDVMQAYDALHRITRYTSTVYIVQSNHDVALDRWLAEADYRIDARNAHTFLKLQLAKHDAIAEGRAWNALPSAITTLIGKDEMPDAWQFLKCDESLMIAGVECGHHGDKGIHGAKGSPLAYRKMGIPTVTGHTHTPQIIGDSFVVGVSAALEMGYNAGASGWRIAHCVIWPNGQRQIIDVTEAGMIY